MTAFIYQLNNKHIILQANRMVEFQY